MAERFVVRESKGEATKGEWAVYDTKTKKEMVTYKRKAAATRDANRRNG